MVRATAMLSSLLILAGCGATPPAQPVSDLKRCAISLETIAAANECTLLKSVCIFTMADMAVLLNAKANKQVYCPTLEPGQEAANN